MRKIKQLAMGQKESLILQLQEMCSADKNQAESEQLPPTLIGKIIMIYVYMVIHICMCACVCVCQIQQGEVYYGARFTCKVLMDRLAALTGTKVPARILVNIGVRITAPRVVHTVITIDKGTSPCAIKVTCNIISRKANKIKKLLQLRHYHTEKLGKS